MRATLLPPGTAARRARRRGRYRHRMADHPKPRFEPSKLEVPGGQKIELHLHNADVAILTHPLISPGIEFYGTIAFQRTAREPGRYGPGEDIPHMHNRIAILTVS